MQIMRLLNGIVVVGTAAFTTTGTTVEVGCGGLGKIHDYHVGALGTNVPTSLEAYYMHEAIVSGGDWVAVPSTGKVTINRKVEVGGTATSGLEIMYCLFGF